MDSLSKWLAGWVDSPLGQLVLFLLVFVGRVALDHWQRVRPKRKKKKQTPVPYGTPTDTL